MSTTVKLDKIFDTSALRRELGKVPKKSADDRLKEQNESMREEKSGIHHKGLPNRSSRFGQSPRRQSGKLEKSGRVKKTGQFSATVSYDSEVAENLVKKGRELLSDKETPRLEDKQKKEVEKVLKDFS